MFLYFPRIYYCERNNLTKNERKKLKMQNTKVKNRQPRWMPSRALITNLLEDYGQAIPKLEQEMLIKLGDGSVLTGKVIEATWKPTGITMVIGGECTWDTFNVGTPQEYEVERYASTYRFFFQVRKVDGKTFGEWRLSNKSRGWKDEQRWTRDDLDCFGTSRTNFKILFDQTFQQWLFEEAE